MPTQNKKLATLAALAGLTQQLSAGPRQDAELAAHEQQNRVSAALQLLGLQQQQQSEAATQAFRESQLTQSGSQFQQSQQLGQDRLAQETAANQGLDTYRHAQLGAEQERYGAEAAHQRATEGQAQENAKRQLQLGVLQQIREAQMSGQPADGVLKYAESIDPDFAKQRQDEYWKNTGESYDQNLPGFNALKTHDPMIDSTFFAMNHVPAETRQWLQQQLPPATPPTPGGPSQLGQLYHQSGLVGAAPAAVVGAGLSLGDLLSHAMRGGAHMMFGQDFDRQIQSASDAADNMPVPKINPFVGNNAFPPANAPQGQMTPEKVAADRQLMQQLLSTIPTNQ